MGRKKRTHEISTSNKKTSVKKVVDEEPDMEEESFFEDEIDKYHSRKERIMLDDYNATDDDQLSDEEEVLSVHGASESDSDMSDVDEEGEDGIPSNTAWGSKRNAFYGADNFDGLEGSDREEAEVQEEREAKEIQQRLATNLDEEDLLFETDQKQALPIRSETSGTDTTKISSDYSKLSLKEQKKLLRKQSPELNELFKDFKEKSEDLKSEIIPLLELVKSGGIPKGPASEFIDMKFRLYSTYLINVAFYLSLKAKKAEVQNHPVVERLVQYRTLINKILPLNDKFQTQVTEYLSRTEVDDGEEREISDAEHEISDAEHEISDVKQYISDEELVTDIPADANEVENMESSSDESDEVVQQKTKQEEDLAKVYYDSIKERIEINENAVKANNEYKNNTEASEEEGGRRAIDYEMQKNKGLRAKRRKIDRNPRVKHRMKYKKALVRRKGQVRDYKPELNKYSGEHSGIRAGVIKSVKIHN